MYERVKNRVRELLLAGEIEGFLALRQDGDHQGPWLFQDPDALEQLVVGDGHEPGAVRYPLLKLVQTLLHHKPQARLGVLVRGCDERALKALMAWNQIPSDRVVVVGIACPQALAEKCGCVQPYPEQSLEGEVSEPVVHHSSSLDRDERPARWTFWMEEFAKCLKCYGCRDICPMCFCSDCALEAEDVVPAGQIPPEFPVFHLIRAVHMIGRCVDCGLCEEACPALIPLRSLYKKINDIISSHFQFRPGFDVTERSPLHQVAEPPPTR